MDTLKQKAIKVGLCKPYQSEWKDDTNLVERYIKGVSWCLKNKAFSLADMLPFDEEMVDNNVFNDKEVDHLLTDNTYIYNNSRGLIEINDWNVSRVYISLNSVIKIAAKSRSILYLDLFDNSNIQIEIEDNAQVYVSQYGNSSVQILSGKAIIKDRRND